MTRKTNPFNAQKVGKRQQLEENRIQEQRDVKHMGIHAGTNKEREKESV